MAYKSDGIASSLRAAGESSVIVEFTNRAAERRYLVGWNVPLVGTVDNNVFEFQAAGARYVGRLVKRLPPRAEDLIPLEPGETVTTEPIDLRTFYRAATGGPSFVVRYRAYHATDPDGDLPQPMVSDWIELPGSLLSGRPA